MTPEQLLTWLGIVTGVGGAAMTYGLLRGRVDEQERRIVVLEERTKETDNVLYGAINTMVRIEEQIRGLTELVKSLQPRREEQIQQLTEMIKSLQPTRRRTPPND
jgi:septal ring factor EnvC (AmiA/AmiB activator)